MKRVFAVVTLAGAMIAGAALADAPGPTWIPHDRVVRMLKQKGYGVTKLEADDGHWEGTAMKRGVRYEFHVDPHSSRVTRMERDHH